MQGVEVKTLIGSGSYKNTKMVLLPLESNRKVSLASNLL